MTYQNPGPAYEKCSKHPSSAQRHVLTLNCLAVFHNAVTKTPDILYWAYAYKRLKMTPIPKIQVNLDWGCMEAKESIHLYLSSAWNVLIEKSSKRNPPCSSSRFGFYDALNTWRIKTNNEVNMLIQNKNIINHIKALIMGWFSHINRMQEDRLVKRIYKN